jgi:hypothetical protein
MMSATVTPDDGAQHQGTVSREEGDEALVLAGEVHAQQEDRAEVDERLQGVAVLGGPRHEDGDGHEHRQHRVQARVTVDEHEDR